MSFSLAFIAEHLGLEVFLPPGSAAAEDIEIIQIAALHDAKPQSISFLSDQKRLPELSSTAASAVIISAQQQSQCPIPALISNNPYLSYAQLTELFLPNHPATAGIHPTAVVADSAQVASSASIGPHVTIAADAVVAENCEIGAGSYIGHSSHVGANTVLAANVTLYSDVQIGQHVTIHSGTVIGAQGFGFAPTGKTGADQQAWQKIHQLGGVVIADFVDIGANTCIDCGTLSPTIIEQGVIIDNQVHIAHNCIIGRYTAIAGATSFAGSTVVGEHCIIAGACAIAGHIEIAAGTQIMGMSKVTGSIKQPGSYSSGTGSMPTSQWRKSAVRFTQLDQMEKRIKQLEKQIQQLSTDRND
ncbi:MAG: UDP-3-O-(3-hydroxymyristoyl)glucosamine N-acyltransferase [Pseudomonadales bacterium]|nr:UDP-3-O-(3-hydroxymyristoyl)glucosamine N-acyltransferase [Pseudomonadales bacterium]